MRTQSWTVTGLLVVLAMPVWGQAQGAPQAGVSQYLDEQGGLSLEEAIGRALDREPALRAARADLDAIRAQSRQAALRRNPTLTFERREEPGGTDSQTSLGIQWPLDLFRRDGRIQTAERELEAADIALSDRERLLASEVRLQYGLAALAAREVEVARDVAATTRRQLELVRERVDIGRTPPLERDLLEVDLRRFDAMHLLATGRADAAFIELRRLLGMGPDEALRLGDTIDVLVTRPAAAAADERVDLRSDVREAQARVAVADARIHQAAREGRFDVSLFASYMRMDAGFPQQGVSAAGTLERVRGRFHSLAGGAMVMLPLFDRNQGRVAAAQSDKAAAEARRQAVDLAARAEVAAARASDTRARQAAGLYTSEIRALARQNLDVVQQTFDLGRATVFDVLLEQRRYLEIEQAYTTALREAWEAQVALTRALGGTR